MRTSQYNHNVPAALHHRIGQLAVVGLAGTSLGPEVRSLAREFDLGGIIIFTRNVESPDQENGSAQGINSRLARNASV